MFCSLLVLRDNKTRQASVYHTPSIVRSIIIFLDVDHSRLLNMVERKDLLINSVCVYYVLMELYFVPLRSPLIGKFQ